MGIYDSMAQDVDRLSGSIFRITVACPACDMWDD
jgi:hypothetical protein